MHPRAGEREQDGGGEHGEAEGEPDVDGQPRDGVGAEQQHRALREVDDAAGAVDDDEPERDERVGRAERDALEEQLEELGHAALPTACSSPRYARMTRSSAWIWRRRADRDRHPEVEHEDAVGDLHDHPHVVLDEQHRQLALAAQAAHQPRDLGALGGVHAGDRLVEQHQARLHGQAARELHALAVAVREELHLGAGVLGKPDELERLHRGAAVPALLGGSRGRGRRAARRSASGGCGRRARSRAPSGARRRRGSGSCARRPSRPSWSGRRRRKSRPSSRTLPASGSYTRERALKSELLPAPFGPITANSSPRRTSKLDVLERGDRAEAQGEVADLEERRPGHPATSSDHELVAARRPEVGAAHGVVEQQLGRRPAHQRPPALQQVGVPGDAQRERRALVGEQDRGARVGDAAQRLADLGDHDRRQPQRRLVEKQQPRLSHQRAADREHLLLTAAQKAGALVERARPGSGTARRPRRAAAARGSGRAPRTRRAGGSDRPSDRRTRGGPRASARCRAPPGATRRRAWSNVRRSGCHP